MSTTMTRSQGGLSVEGNLDPFILIKPSELVRDALQKLQDSVEKFVLVGEATSHPYTLLAEPHLRALAKHHGDLALAQVSSRLPALFLVHEKVDLWQGKRVSFYCQMTYATTAPALLIWDGKRAIGAVSIDSLFDRAGKSLNQDDYNKNVLRFVETPVAGRRIYDILSMDIDWCVFFCSHYDCPGVREEPSCTPPPICPVNSGHGTMQERL